MVFKKELPKESGLYWGKFPNTTNTEPFRVDVLSKLVYSIGDSKPIDYGENGDSELYGLLLCHDKIAPKKFVVLENEERICEFIRTIKCNCNSTDGVGCTNVGDEY